MRYSGALALALLGACGSSGGSAPKEPTPFEPFSMGRREIDANILKIPPYYKLTDPDDGKTYIIRYYAMHNPGADNEVAIVTLGSGETERIATVQEWWRAMKLRQKLITDEGTRQDRLLRAFYNGDQIRKSTALNERIVYKKGEIEDLNTDVGRLKRNITAIEQVAPATDEDRGNDKQQVEALMQILKDRQTRLDIAVIELAILEHLREQREMEIAGLKPPFEQKQPVPLPNEQLPPPPK